MTITVFSDNKEIPVNRVDFSDGAFTFKVDELPYDPQYITINVCPKTPVSLVREEITLIMDAIQRKKCKYGCDPEINLNLPYLPYGRADRVFEDGNPLPLDGIIDFLQEQCFNRITICDPHNLDENELEEYSFDFKSQLDCYKESLPRGFNKKYGIVIAPDKGAKNKATTIANYLNVDIGYCEKERDMATGRIVKSTLPDVDFTGKKVLIPDDLCDGGFTFIKLAEQLKEAGAAEVDLYVTHLIAAKGLDCFKGLIDNIFCYHTVGNYVNKQNVWEFNDAN